MYDLVGDKVREIFDAQSVDISVVDRDAGLHPLRLLDREGRPRRTTIPSAIIGFRKHVLETGRAARALPVT